MFIRYYLLQDLTAHVFCWLWMSTVCPSCSGFSQVKVMEKFQDGLVYIKLNSKCNKSIVFNHKM